MKIDEQAVTIKKSAAKVWEQLSKVESWPVWDQSLEECSFKGLFQEGGRGLLKPRGSPFFVSFYISNFSHQKRFDIVSKLPLGNRIVFEHYLDHVEENKVILLHKVFIKGCLSFLLNLVIGKGMKKALAPSMKSLKEMIERS